MELFKKKCLRGRQWLAIFGICMAAGTACRKTEEPPLKVGAPLTYTDSVTKTLQQVLDSLPDAAQYRAMLQRSDLLPYMDSLANGNARTPFTFFVPTDKALTAAGFTMDLIRTAPVAQLDTLVRYLSVTGNVRPNPPSKTGVNLYPMLYPDPALSRSEGLTPFVDWSPYYYTLNLSFASGALWLNGIKVSSQINPILATNGTLYRIDTLVQKPFYDLYQLLSQDTSYNYYMAALRISDSLYAAKGIMGGTYISNYCDTVTLQLVNYYVVKPGTNPFSIVLAPTNDAFRKAGFETIGDIGAYIAQSALATGTDFAYMYTNMDSILNNHQFSYGFFVVVDWNNFYYYQIFGANYVFTNDMLNDPAIVQQSYAPIGQPTRYSIHDVVFQNNGGSVVAHRTDNLSGAGATVISPYNVMAVNGVLHRVDNLLMPAR